MDNHRLCPDIRVDSMTNPQACWLGERLWGRITTKNGYFHMSRYAHYWLHIFICPFCRWRFALDDRMLGPHRITLTIKEYNAVVKENWRRLGFDWNPDR